LPDAKASVERWRRVWREAGIGEVHLVAALTHGNWEFEALDFDAGVEFPPHNVRERDRKPELKLYEPIEGWVHRYNEVAERLLSHDYRSRRVYRGIHPSWDNSARVSGDGLITLDATPENYERWLHRATQKTLFERKPGQRLLFINAWNEWAEGCHLEPDRRYGLAFLEATLRVKESRPSCATEGATPPTTTLLPEPRPLIRLMARLLQPYPRLFRTAQVAWRDILALRGRLGRIRTPRRI
jgi:hypothetical protein